MDASSAQPARVVGTPVCRLARCSQDAYAHGGFCFEHGLTYALWRARRDALEAADLAQYGRPSDDLLADDPALAEALDLLSLHLLRGPFE